MYHLQQQVLKRKPKFPCHWSSLWGTSYAVHGCVSVFDKFVNDASCIHSVFLKRKEWNTKPPIWYVPLSCIRPPCHYPPIADNAQALQWRSGCPLNCEPHACDLLKGNTQTKSFMRQMAPNVSIIMVLNTKSKLSVSTQSPNCCGKRWLFQPHQLLGRRGTKEKERSLCLTNIDSCL